MTGPGFRHGDEGAATVLAAAFAGVLALVALAVLAVGQLAVTRQRTALAADTAALAASARLIAGDDGDAACTRAAELADRSGARLVSCRVEVLDVEVVVAGPGPRWLVDLLRRAGSGDGWVRVAARAGPPAGVVSPGSSPAASRALTR